MTHSSAGDAGSATSSTVSSVGGQVGMTVSAPTLNSNPSRQPAGVTPSLQVGVSISKEFEISAAHHLPDHPGKCRNPHGHNYRIRVTLVGTIDQRTGMIKDFYDVAGDFDNFIGVFDHKDLNDYYLNPTAENLSVSWLERLHRKDPRYHSVVVWETDDCFAVASIK